MTEQLIGLGFCECIDLMVEYGLPIDEVSKIVCSGREESDADWENLLKFAKNIAEPYVIGGYNIEGVEYSEKFHNIAEQLRDQGKIDFLGNINPQDKPYTGYGFWTKHQDFIVSEKLHDSAFWDFAELTRTGKIKSSPVINNGRRRALSNIVYEFDRDALAAIRAKHKPGFRKAIAQFFGG